MEVNKNRLISWLQELIRIPSITGQEEAIAGYVSQELSKLGYKPQQKENNVFLEIGQGSKSLLLNAHLDTVDVSGQWTYDPFKAVIKNGKIYGRGSSDDKGNIAAMLEIARLARSRQLNGRLIFTFTTGEEYGAKLEAKGSYLLSKILKADKALVLEPQTDVEDKRMNIIYGCRGIENIKVHIRGKAAHTGYPEQGINAISKSVEILSKLEKIDFHKVATPDEEITTICLPIFIKGGADIFRVPDKCEIIIHCRTAPEDTEITKQIEQICREVCAENFTMEILYSAPGYIENPNDPMVTTICREAETFGYSTRKRFAGGRIDASIFKALGRIPSFCTGVGNRNQMHLVDEYITLEDFISCSEIIKNITFSYLS